jgi:hypothetical protein
MKSSAKRGRWRNFSENLEILLELLLDTKSLRHKALRGSVLKGPVVSSNLASGDSDYAICPFPADRERSERHPASVNPA